MKRFLSTREMAFELGVSTSYITELVRSGKLAAKSTPIGKGKKKIYQFTRGTMHKYIWKEEGLEGILKFPVLKELVKKIGPDIENFFGDEPGCLVCDIPGGFLYGIALLFYLNGKQKDVTFVCMGKGTGPWPKESLDGRRILLVDDFSKSGRTLQKMEEVLRKRCKEANIKIKEVKTFVYDNFAYDFDNHPTTLQPTFFIRESYKKHLEDIDIQLR